AFLSLVVLSFNFAAISFNRAFGQASSSRFFVGMCLTTALAYISISIILLVSIPRMSTTFTITLYFPDFLYS
ncbi:MAG: hypothetical protein J7L95_07885, partial [Prolixibacteraceae bacterium]|nr:hypothetical protein [Prolixibacteraceae bacterium]